MYRSYSKFYEELQKAIRKRYDEGKPKEIKNDLKLLSEKFQMDFSEADLARKSIENNIMKKWTSERSELSGAGLRKESSPLPPSKGELDLIKVGGELRLDIYRAVDRGLRNNMSMAEISALLERTANFGGYRARGVARTAKMGKIRSEYLENHLKAGCRKFRYAGPTGASSSADKPRDFCQKHLGKVYTIEEIQKLDNGQGLPVLIYMGGYNCRHRWEAVYDNDELRIANEDKNKLRTDTENSYVDEDYTELRNKIAEDLKTIKSKEREKYIINQIRNLKKETAFVLNKKNELIYHNEADNDNPNSVDINYKEKGCTIIHNHPGEDMSFSYEDIEMAIIRRASKIVAASSERIYILTIDSELCENDDAERRFFDIYESKIAIAAKKAEKLGMKGNEKDNFVRREAYTQVSRILKLTTYKEGK